MAHRGGRFMFVSFLASGCYFNLLADRIGGEYVFAEIEHYAGTVFAADAVLDLSLPVLAVLQSLVISEGNLALVQLYKVAIYRFEIAG